MIKQRKYSGNMIKDILKKDLLWLKIMEILRTQLNVGFAIMLMMIDVNVDVKVRNHCYILENIETLHIGILLPRLS